MTTSAIVVDKVRQLTAAGQHAEVVNYLAARQGSELVESASLALLYGTAQARLGRHAEGLRWLDTALEQARKGGERGVESRALNARGAMSLVSGRLDEAADYCTRALMLASLDGDSATVGRCSNNLGIVSNLRGRHAEAIGSWEIARAAFERAGWRQGVGECHHNLGITYREQGAFDRALAEANRAVAEGELRNLARQSWDEAFATELRGSLAPLHVAQELADAGRYGELLTYLSARSQEELEQSPMLTLLCGIAHSRLGRLDLGQQWAMVAQLRARMLGDRTLEVRALNVSGAVALERGGIDEASYFFTRAQEQAMQDNDMATVGRCANNLGIIANMQGDYARAVGAYTRAIAAYEQAGFHRGIAESRHNLGITYPEQGRLDHALEAADAAVRDAEWLNDRGFKAQALAGRAEIRLAQGEPELAIREAQEALASHRERKDGGLEAEDLRILAVALGLAGRMRDAEEMLRAVIARATKHDRPLLVASAQRDLASLLHRIGDRPAATVMAQAARVTFDRLGATAEIAKLDALDATMASSSRRAQP